MESFHEDLVTEYEKHNPKMIQLIPQPIIAGQSCEN